MIFEVLAAFRRRCQVGCGPRGSGFAESAVQE